MKPGMRLSLAVAAYHGKSNVDMNRFEDAADIFGAMSTLHGLAHLVLEGKAAHFFQDPTSQTFVKRNCPRCLSGCTQIIGSNLRRDPSSDKP